jgi:dihydrofolate reductase
MSVPPPGSQVSDAGANQPDPVRVALVVARAANGVIGVDGKLPWHISADLQHFKRLTVGKPIIMGRKTYESIGKPLPRRTNIVVTRDTAWTAAGVVVAHDLSTALALGYEDLHRTGAREVMVIGGAEIFRESLPLAQRIYLTEVHRAYEGETVFAADLSAWRQIERADHPPETPDGAGFSFITLEKT